MPSPRQDLLRLLASKSFRLGEFKLSSGGTSDYYIDCRTTTLDAKGARLTGEVFSDEIRQRGWKPQAIGGLTLGADPIVTAVSVVSGELHGFLVRKAEKQHGTGQRIEGFREKGARVVIVDDVCTTGASTVQAIEAAREFGFEIVGRDVPGGARRSERKAKRREGRGPGAVRLHLYRPRRPHRACYADGRHGAHDFCSRSQLRSLRPAGSDECSGNRCAAHRAG